MALADEVRRRVEAAAPADAARGQERRRVRRQEGRRRLGQRPGRVVVCDHHGQRPRLDPFARAPEGGDERGQDRLGHARTGDAGRRAGGVGRKVRVAEQVGQGQLGPGQGAVHLLLQAVHTGMVGCVPPCRRRSSECAV